MNTGKKRHPVMLQRATTSRDTFGQTIETWSDVGKVWAAIEPATGREVLTSREVIADVTHKLTTRYRPDVTPQMRVKFGERVFDIQAAFDPDDRGKELLLLCREMV